MSSESIGRTKFLEARRKFEDTSKPKNQTGFIHNGHSVLQKTQKSQNIPIPLHSLGQRNNKPPVNQKPFSIVTKGTDSPPTVPPHRTNGDKINEEQKGVLHKPVYSKEKPGPLKAEIRKLPEDKGYKEIQKKVVQRKDFSRSSYAQLRRQQHQQQSAAAHQTPPPEINDSPRQPNTNKPPISAKPSFITSTKDTAESLPPKVPARWTAPAPRSSSLLDLDLELPPEEFQRRANKVFPSDKIPPSSIEKIEDPQKEKVKKPSGFKKIKNKVIKFTNNIRGKKNSSKSNL